MTIQIVVNKRREKRNNDSGRMIATSVLGRPVLASISLDKLRRLPELWFLPQDDDSLRCGRGLSEVVQAALSA